MGGSDHLANLMDGGSGPGPIGSLRQRDSVVKKREEEHGERPENCHRGDGKSHFFIRSPDHRIGGNNARRSTDGGSCSEKQGKADRKTNPTTPKKGGSEHSDNGDQIESEAAPSSSRDLLCREVEAQSDHAEPQKLLKGEPDPGIESRQGEKRRELPEFYKHWVLSVVRRKTVGIFGKSRYDSGVYSGFPWCGD